MPSNDTPNDVSPPEDAAPVLEHGTYEVIRNRLSAAGKDLRGRLDRLNAARKDVFGAIETRLLATERVTTAHNCIARDMTPIGDCFLFGYNVHLGLKSVASPADVFAVYRFSDHTFSEQPLDSDRRRALSSRLRRVVQVLQEKRFLPSSPASGRICTWSFASATTCAT